MGKFEHAKFKVAETSNVTEVSISCWPHDGSGDAASERVVFGTPLVLKAGDEVLMVMARRIVELEAQVERMKVALKERVPRSVYEAAIKGEGSG